MVNEAGFIPGGEAKASTCALAVKNDTIRKLRSNYLKIS
jgi:hypothetical protein